MKPDPTPADKQSADAESVTSSEIQAVRKKLHLPWLDGIRAVAAFYVVCHHCALNVSGEPNFGRWAFLRSFLGYGHFAVDVFIVLSGFCLMLPVCAVGTLKGGSRRFLLRRALRILPTYYLSLAISTAACLFFLNQPTGTHWDVCLPVDWQSIVSHVLLIQDLFKDTSARLNHAMWSISVEWRIYFLFPIGIVWGFRYGFLKVAWMAVLLSYIALALLNFTPINTDAAGSSVYYFGLFFVGVYACQISYGAQREAVSEKSIKVALIASFAVLALMMVGHFHGRRVPLQVLSLPVGICAATTMALLARDQFRILKGILSWSPLVFVGTFGYTLYLLHAPTIQAEWLWIVAPLQTSVVNQMFILLALTPITVLVCYLAFLLIERPFIRYLAKLR